MKIKIINKGKNPLPEYAHEGDACMDLRANFENSFNDDLGEGCAWDDVAQCVRLFPGGRCLIGTGLFTEFSNGVLIVKSRSGLSIKNGIYAEAGVIDANYRGEIGVVLSNNSSDDFEIRQGDRIAQMMWLPIDRIEWELPEKLNKSKRGKGGFGSTGKK